MLRERWTFQKKCRVKKGVAEKKSKLHEIRKVNLTNGDPGFRLHGKKPGSLD